MSTTTTAHALVIATLIDALNERDLFSNPHRLDQAAGEIDCCPDCDRTWHESDTNAGGCRASERGEFCGNDVAETLRAVARISRAAAELGGLELASATPERIPRR